jgi:hypothetical protein
LTDTADPFASTEAAFLAEVDRRVADRKTSAADLRELAEVYRSVTLARCAIEAAVEAICLCPACEAEREAAEAAEWRQ